MRTYKLFDGIDEEFNLVSRSYGNIQNVCEIMCQCKFLSDQEVEHYIHIGGFVPEQKGDEKFLTFEKRWGKHNYLIGMASVLFKDCPSLYEIDSKGDPKLKSKVKIGDTTYKGEELREIFNTEECYSAFGFFLSCIGETLHDHSLYLNILAMSRSLGINLEEIGEDGEV